MCIPTLRCSRLCLMVRESGDPKSREIYRDASSGCSNAARGEERATLGSGVWAFSLPILRGSIRRTHQDQAGCVDGVARCRSMDLKGPSSSLARALAWPSLSSTARQGKDSPHRSFRTQPSSSASDVPHGLVTCNGLRISREVSPTPRPFPVKFRRRAVATVPSC